MTKWLGSKTCDFCGIGINFVTWFADARTKNGQWALMCSKCHRTHAMSQKFGPGIGQKYSGRTLEKLEG